LKRIAYLAWIALSISNLPAQTSAAAPTSLTDPAPSFEVVSIKPSKPGATGNNSNFSGNRFTATNATLKSLIQYDAYAIPGPQILDIPPSLANAAFDIEASIDPEVYARIQKLPNGQASLQFEHMVQQLLADRFKLTVHTETRELPIYALVVAKGGAKLQPAKDPEAGMRRQGRNGQLSAQGVTMADLAVGLTRTLEKELGRVIIDQTGLTGKYDLVLKWTPESGPPPMLNGEPDTSAPSIFTAVQDQLGLKLQATKGGVPVLVVDHAELPTEN
jgi:uncharacterized protein (TIGR03435 family)